MTDFLLKHFYQLKLLHHIKQSTTGKALLFCFFSLIHYLGLVEVKFCFDGFVYFFYYYVPVLSDLTPLQIL